MSKSKAWIHAFRLRTLPLALSSIALGAFLAFHDGTFSLLVSLLAGLTTLFLQILSNLANDYGDSKKGVDNEERLGPVRAVQSGDITASQMKKGVIILAGLSLISGLSLLYFAFKDQPFAPVAWAFFLIGIGAIAAAIKYTVGKNPYGYSGLGDLFVFLFFGLTAVLGTYFLNAHTINWEIFLPASSMGFLSTGVLNLNNMRDQKNDAANNKNTLVVKMGYGKAKVYHYFLIITAWLAMIIYGLLNMDYWWQMIFVLLFPLFLKQLLFIAKNQEPQLLDPLLKQLALSTFFLMIAFGVLLVLGTRY